MDAINFKIINKRRCLNGLDLPMMAQEKKDGRKVKVNLLIQMMSFTHGFVAFLLACYAFLKQKTECGELNTPYQRNVMIFSFSYFTYELIAMYFEGILDTAMTIHHKSRSQVSKFQSS